MQEQATGYLVQIIHYPFGKLLEEKKFKDEQKMIEWAEKRVKKNKESFFNEYNIKSKPGEGVKVYYHYVYEYSESYDGFQVLN